MQCTGYYRILDNSQNDIEDLSDTLLVNCTGKMHKNTAFIGNSSRSDFYILYITEGQMTAYFDGNPTIISNGTGVIYYPGTNYYYKFTNEKSVLAYYWVHFTGSEALNLLKRFGFHNEFVFTIGVHNNIIQLFDKMAMEIIERKEDFAYAAASYIPEILIQIKRYLSLGSGQTNPNRLSRSIEYIHKKFHHDIAIEQLAQMENCSSSRYRAIFKEITGVSPKSYLTAIRMRAACELLCQTSVPINEIATTVGYDNQMYFCRIFKKEMKITPSQYRKIHNQIS